MGGDDYPEVALSNSTVSSSKTMTMGCSTSSDDALGGAGLRPAFEEGPAFTGEDPSITTNETAESASLSSSTRAMLPRAGGGDDSVSACSVSDAGELLFQQLDEGMSDEDDEDETFIDDEDEPMEERVRFLNEKRALLLRASWVMESETLFGAHIAKSDAAAGECNDKENDNEEENDDDDNAEASIWVEAKQVLQELTKRAGTTTDAPAPRKKVSFSSVKRSSKHTLRQRKKVQIEFAPSVDLVTVKEPSNKGPTVPDSVPSNETYGDVDLTGDSKQEENPTIKDWEMMVDSMTAVPKTAAPDARVALEDALIVTETPQ